MNPTQQEVFMGLYTPCHQAFMGYCRGLTGNRDDALDLAGEAVLIVFENLERLRKKDSFKAYLFGVARRLRLHQYRKNRFRGEYSDRVAEMLADQGSPADASYDVEVLYNLLGKLPPTQREAIVLFEISGFSLEEIRQLQGGTLSGVKTRLRRGREQLRLWLQDPPENIVETDNYLSLLKAQVSKKDQAEKGGTGMLISNPGLQAGDSGPIREHRLMTDDHPSLQIRSEKEDPK